MVPAREGAPQTRHTFDTGVNAVTGAFAARAHAAEPADADAGDDDGEDDVEEAVRPLHLPACFTAHGSGALCVACDHA